MKKILYTCTIIFLFSCSKEKKLAKVLEGNWTVISHRNNGNLQAIEIDGSIFNFSLCPADDNKCEGSWSGSMSNNGTFNFPYYFSINDEDDISLTFDSLDVDTLIEPFVNAELFFEGDTMELEFISNNSFFEFTMLK